MPARPLEEAEQTIIVGLALIVLFLVVTLRQVLRAHSSGHAAELAVSACCQQSSGCRRYYL